MYDPRVMWLHHRDLLIKLNQKKNYKKNKRKVQINKPVVKIIYSEYVQVK